MRKLISLIMAIILSISFASAQSVFPGTGNKTSQNLFLGWVHVDSGLILPYKKAWCCFPNAPGSLWYNRYGDSGVYIATGAGDRRLLTDQDVFRDSLNNLTDVAITGLVTGQLIRYNGTTHKWENFTPTYITSEVDPVFTASIAFYITALDTTHYNTAWLKFIASSIYSGGGVVTYTRNDGTTFTMTGLPQGTVTSVTAGTGLSGGTITGTGTISMPNVGTAGTYGSSTLVPIITTDAQGRISSVSTAAIGGGTVTSVSVATANGFAGSSSGGATPALTFSVTPALGSILKVGSGGSVTAAVAGTDYQAAGSYMTTTLTNGFFWIGNGSNIATAVQASGDWTISNTGVATLKNTGTPGTYGSATQIPVVTTDAQGRITTVTTATPSVTHTVTATGDVTGTGNGNGVITVPLVYANVVPVSKGGMNKSSAIQYAIPYASSTTVYTEQAIGSAGQVLAVNGSANGYTWTGPSAFYTSLYAGANVTVSGTAPSFTVSTTASVTPTASTIAKWDANLNLGAVNLLLGYTAVTSAGTTTTLVVGSSYRYYVTGTSAQTFQMPVTSTLTIGQSYLLINATTNYITVNSSGGNVMVVMEPNSTVVLLVKTTGATTAADWVVQYAAPNKIIVSSTGNSTTIIPAGSLCVGISFLITSTTNVAVGTTIGGVDVVPTTSVTSGVLTTFSTMKQFSRTANTTLYITCSGTYTADFYKIQ